jgi:hypothetical protein
MHGPDARTGRHRWRPLRTCAAISNGATASRVATGYHQRIMRALSVRQPWAELIARGKKKKEFRTWSRSCFGELLIVASKAVDADAIRDEGLDPASLAFGRAVCVVDFHKVTGDDDDGYAWHFRYPRRVEPIDVKGSASLYHVPDDRIRVVGEGDSKAAAKARRVPSRAKARRVPPG